MLYMLIAVLILIDQAVKYFVVASMYLGQSISVLPSVRLTYLTNTGMAFSLFQNANTFFICGGEYVIEWFKRIFVKLPRCGDVPYYIRVFIFAAD